MVGVTTFYIGMNVGGQPAVNQDRRTVAALDRIFPGYTYAWARGRWKGESERTLVVTVVELGEEEATRHAAALCTELKQEEILHVTVTAEVCFTTGENQ